MHHQSVETVSFRLQRGGCGFDFSLPVFEFGSNRGDFAQVLPKRHGPRAQMWQGRPQQEGTAHDFQRLGIRQEECLRWVPRQSFQRGQCTGHLLASIVERTVAFGGCFFQLRQFCFQPGENGFLFLRRSRRSNEISPQCRDAFLESSAFLIECLALFLAGFDFPFDFLEIALILRRSG